jgi:D-alanine--poly(phosphoribitol) ligase subunit 2
MADAAEIRRAVLAWFSAKGTVPGASESEQLAADYFAAGLIDSLAVVELVVDLEAKFGVRFEDTHFQQRRFSTIGGLAEIVAEIVAQKAA